MFVPCQKQKNIISSWARDYEEEVRERAKRKEEAARRESHQSRPPFKFEDYNAIRTSEEYAAMNESIKHDNDMALLGNYYKDPYPYEGGNKKKHLKKSRRRRLIKKSKTRKRKTRKTRK